MKSSIWKRGILTLLLLFLSVWAWQPVYAQEDYTMDLRLETNKNVQYEGVSFRLIQAARERNGEYELLPPFSSSKIDLSQLQGSTAFKAAARELCTLYEASPEQAETAGILTTDASGQARLDGLKAGGYLLICEMSSSYKPYAPALVMIPDHTNSTGDMTVHVRPKYLWPELNLTKTNTANHRPVTGKDFSFGLYSDPDCTKLIQTIQGDPQTGTLQYIFDGYKTVYLKELCAPEGFILSGEVIKLTFSESGFFINDWEASPTDEYKFSFRFGNTPNDGLIGGTNPGNPDKPETDTPGTETTPEPDRPDSSLPTTGPDNNQPNKDTSSGISSNKPSIFGISASTGLQTGTFWLLLIALIGSLWFAWRHHKAGKQGR